MRRLHPRNQPAFKPSPYEFIVQLRNLIRNMPYVLIIKDDHEAHCQCYDDLEHSADVKCPICFGTGWIPTILKVRCYHQPAGRANSLTKTIDLIEPAKVAIDTEFFYFLPEIGKLEVGHIIVTYRPDTDGQIPFDTMEFYEVNHCPPRFDEMGRDIIYKVACERDPITAKNRSQSLFRLRDTIKEIEIP